jgi:membrane fusion protein
VWGDYARKETVRGYLVPEEASGLPDGRLRAELFIPMRVMGFVEVGQPVRLHFDAFPSRRFGTVVGEVVELGEVVQRPTELSPPVMREEFPYRVSVRLAEQEISVFGKRVPLRSGMLLEAELILERRSLLGWLLEPLDALRRGV